MIMILFFLIKTIFYGCFTGLLTLRHSEIKKKLRRNWSLSKKLILDAINNSSHSDMNGDGGALVTLIHSFNLINDQTKLIVILNNGN